MRKEKRMGHNIYAFIGKPEVIQSILNYVPQSKINLTIDFISLPQNYKILFAAFPLLEYFDELFHDSSSFYLENFKTTFVNHSMIKFIETYCTTGQLAYIEIDYFGGAGEQAALFFENGKLIYLQKNSHWLIHSV